MAIQDGGFTYQLSSRMGNVLEVLCSIAASPNDARNTASIPRLVCLPDQASWIIMIMRDTHTVFTDAVCCTARGRAGWKGCGRDEASLLVTCSALHLLIYVCVS